MKAHKKQVLGKLLIFKNSLPLYVKPKKLVFSPNSGLIMMKFTENSKPVRATGCTKNYQNTFASYWERPIFERFYYWKWPPISFLRPFLDENSTDLENFCSFGSNTTSPRYLARKLKNLKFLIFRSFFPKIRGALTTLKTPKNRKF